MFKRYYSLSFNPFDKQQMSKKDHFESHDYSEMNSRLNYLKDTRGIGLFTASPGMGKTYALRCFSEDLNPNRYRMAYICLSTISVAEFYKEFCTLLGVDDKGGKPGRFRSIQEQVWYLYHEKKQPLLLAIDEAQYLSTGIFNDFKMLMNHGYDSINCFTLILCGEPHLNNILNKPVHEALKQRITIHYNFQGMSDEEAIRYVEHKLRIAGAAQSIIEDAALKAVAGHTHGNPRLIDNLMTDALTIGAQTDKKVIDTEVILAAVNNQNLI